MRWLYSVRFHVILAISICVLGTILSWWLLTERRHAWLPWLANWLLIVNVVTFAYYGVDKYLASRLYPVRIPEIVLHTLAALGGSPAALLAMWLFRHKTIKTSFRILFWGIVILQFALLAYVVKLLWWDT
jgi:uncharacterized membrane protein YsdA (DUF1294 family)